MSRHLPAEEEKVAAAQFTTEGLAKPEQGLFKSVSRAHFTEFNGPAEGTARREEARLGVGHSLWGLGRADDGRADLAVSRRFGVAAAHTAAGADAAAGFAIGANLFGGSQVGLGRLDVLLGALDLALMTFRNSLIHKKPFLGRAPMRSQPLSSAEMGLRWGKLA